MHYDINSGEGVFILLPSCAYPSADVKWRARGLFENILYLQRIFPKSEILVVDNGVKSPSVPEGAGLIYAPELNTSHASLGEVQLLLRGLKEIPVNATVLKLHARCPLVNVNAFKRFVSVQGEYLLFNRNFFVAAGKGSASLPYVDTRTMLLQAAEMTELLGAAKVQIERGVGNFEQAIVPLLYSKFTERLVLRGSFYPIFSGMSGHGKSYASPISFARSQLKGLIYRLGV